MFGNVYNGKKVLVTGHTGFKGAWLTCWLIKLGARVVGVSRDVPTQPSMFEELGLDGRLKHIQADIRDLEVITSTIQSEEPDFIFHLAAQAIVSTSYKDPIDTFTTNVVGTMNILEAFRDKEFPCTIVLITSDKCYDNVEWVWGYKETDALGGKDIYSGSKGGAELVIKSYIHSFFSQSEELKIGIGRAGNVIGGGDWAKDRIVVDCMKAWSQEQPVEIRSPNATRPWQHVLEPLSGYLTLGQKLACERELHGEAFNFGPRSEQNRTVVDLLSDLGQRWGLNAEQAYTVTDNIPFHEAGLLKLNCDKALFYLKWESNLQYEETIELISDWYSGFYKDRCDLFELTIKQISFYEELAKERARVWVNDFG